VRRNFQRLAVAAAATAFSAWSHFTWVSPATADFQAGKTVQIRVSHGDVFPNTEESIQAGQVRIIAVAPSGARTYPNALNAKTFVSAEFTPRETGSHRIAFTQDRGAMSRTPKGVRPGGRDRNADATEAFTMLRTGVWHSGKGHKPVGLDVELTADRDSASGAWQVQLLRRGKPYQGQKVQVVGNGAKDGVEAGVTNPDGKIVWKPAAGAKGPVMFLAEFSEKAPAGGSVDTNRFSTTLYLSW